MDVVVGRIGRAHGVRGELTVEVRTDEPARRFAVGTCLQTDPLSAGLLPYDPAAPPSDVATTTTDQATGELRGPEPLATLATYRDSKEFGIMFGMNCVTLTRGAVKVGDALEIS